VHACRSGKNAAPAVITAAAAVADLEDAVLATGTLEPAKLVSVGAQASGQIRSLKVALGDRVKRGQLIAEIDAMTQQNALKNARASLATVEAQRRAKQASLQMAELAFQRAERLLPSLAGTRADYEAAEATLDTTRAELSGLEAQLDQARIAVDSAAVNLGYTRITAPIDGVVVAVAAEEGQTVNAAQSAPTLVKIARVDTMTVKAQISEADVTRVRVGLPVHFTILGAPDVRRTGTLRAVEPAPVAYGSDSSSSLSTASSPSSSSSSGSTAVYYNGLCDVENEDGVLRISMTAQVSIVLSRARGALVIPSGALGPRGAGGAVTVQVEEGERLVPRLIRVGIDNHDQAQVLEGLHPGERVVVGEAEPGGASLGGRPPPPGMF
jgi:macrolide-specific efflux system membrane fusion protein